MLKDNIKKGIILSTISLIIFLMNMFFVYAADNKSPRYKSGYEIENVDGHNIITVFNDDGDLSDNFEKSGNGGVISVIAGTSNSDEVEATGLMKVMPHYSDVLYSRADLFHYSSDDLSLALAELIGKYEESKLFMTFDKDSRIWSNSFILGNIKELQYVLSSFYVKDNALINIYNTQGKLSQKFDVFLNDYIDEDFDKYARYYNEYKLISKSFKIIKTGELIDSLYYPVWISGSMKLTVKKEILDKLQYGDELRLYTCERDKMNNENYTAYKYVDDYYVERTRSAKTNNFLEKIFRFFGKKIETEKQKYLKFEKLYTKKDVPEGMEYDEYVKDVPVYYYYISSNDDGKDGYVYSMNETNMIEIYKDVSFKIRLLKNARIYYNEKKYGELPTMMYGYPFNNFFDVNAMTYNLPYKGTYKDLTTSSYVDDYGDVYENDYNYWASYMVFDNKGYATAMHIDNYNLSENKKYYGYVYAKNKDVKFYSKMDDKDENIIDVKVNEENTLYSYGEFDFNKKTWVYVELPNNIYGYVKKSDLAKNGK